MVVESKTPIERARDSSIPNQIINPFFFDFVDGHKSRIKEKCKKDGVNYWEWRVFVDQMVNFYNAHNKYVNVNSLQNEKLNYHNTYLLKKFLQNDYLADSKERLKRISKEIEKYRDKVFSFLEKHDDYYWIFTPVWRYKTQVFKKGYYPYLESGSGVNNVTLFVAKEWALYKLNN